MITSPPYLNTTSYREDQRLRLWFLGEDIESPVQNDGRHHSVKKYRAFLEESWAGVTPLLADGGRAVVTEVAGKGGHVAGGAGWLHGNGCGVSLGLRGFVESLIGEPRNQSWFFTKVATFPASFIASQASSSSGSTKFSIG